MRKIINSKMETIRVRSIQDRASDDCSSKECVLEMHPTARAQSNGAKLWIVRDRNVEHDGLGLVPYVYMTGPCYTSKQAWDQAKEGLFP